MPSSRVSTCIPSRSSALSTHTNRSRDTTLYPGGRITYNRHTLLSCPLRSVSQRRVNSCYATARGYPHVFLVILLAHPATQFPLEIPPSTYPPYPLSPNHILYILVASQPPFNNSRSYTPVPPHHITAAASVPAPALSHPPIALTPHILPKLHPLPTAATSQCIPAHPSHHKKLQLSHTKIQYG